MSTRINFHKPHKINSFSCKNSISKKWLLLSSTFLLLFVFTGCSSNNVDTMDNFSNSSQEEQVSTDLQPAEDIATSHEKDTPVNDIEFNELTVIDNDECSIVITGIDPDGFWGYTVNALLENKSADKIYMFSVLNASIDGVESDPYFAAEVAAGKKANVEVSFSDTILDDIGIQYSDIFLTWDVYDSNDWLSDSVATETVHIYPKGENNAEIFVRETQGTDIVLADNDSITAIITDFDPDGFWGYTVNIYLINKTDKNIMFSVDNVSVNGFMADPFWATEVHAGNCAFSSLSWDNTTLEDNGITEIEEIEFSFHASDNDDWLSDPIMDEIFTLNP